MTIKIDKNKIAEALKRESSLVSKGAFTNNGSSLHDIIYIDEQEFAVLDSAYQDALSTIVLMAREFLTSEPDLSQNVVKLSLQKSDPSLEESLTKDIYSFITKRMMAEWLAMVYPTQSQMYLNAALSMQNHISYKLYYKNPPMR